MHHRSFWTGFTVLMVMGCIVVGGGLFAIRHTLLPADTVSASVDSMVVPESEPVYPELSATSSRVSVASSTATALLHEPPLSYLMKVKGDPRISVQDIPVRVPILMYHHVRPMLASFTAKDRLYSVTPESFEAQMRGLKKAGYTTISPRDLEAAIEGRAMLPTNPVLLTFDDGYREHYTRVLPLLRELNFQATYFIITGATQLGGYMKKDMIREAYQTGLVTIADHTRNHPFLAHMSLVTRAPEITESKKDLEAIIDHPVYDFAYPYGSWNQDVADEVKAAGYTLGFGIRLGSLHASSTRYELRRIRVLNEENVTSLVGRFSKP